jgi:hypothetical protein
MWVPRSHIRSQSAMAVSCAFWLVCSTAKEPAGGRGVTGTSANAILALEQKIAAARMMSRI